MGREKGKQTDRDPREHGGRVLLAFICAFVLTVTTGIIGLFVYRWASGRGSTQDPDDAFFTQIPEEEIYREKQDMGKDDPEAGSDNVTGTYADTGSDAETAGGDDEGADATAVDDPDEAYVSQDAVTAEEDAYGDDMTDWANGRGDDFTRYVESEGSGRMSFTFAGDILFDPGYAIMGSIKRNGGTLSGVIDGNLMELLRGADVAVLHNEFSYSNRGEPTPDKTFTFRARPESAELLTEAGIDLASFANNHSYDYGPDALVDSIDAVRAQGIATVGAGRNIDEASQAVTFIDQSGLQVAVIAATQIERLDPPDTKGATADSPGVFRCLDDTKLLKRIREAKDEGAKVIVFIHWGTENEEAIDYWQKKQAPEIAEAGADLIIGCHPHILQGIDYVNGIPVVYSLGNFLFNSRKLDSCLVTAIMTKDGVDEVRFIPALQSDCTVRLAVGDERARILSHMREMSPGVNIADDGTVSRPQ